MIAHESSVFRSCPQHEKARFCWVADFRVQCVLKGDTISTNFIVVSSKHVSHACPTHRTASPNSPLLSFFLSHILPISRSKSLLNSCSQDAIRYAAALREHLPPLLVGAHVHDGAHDDDLPNGAAWCGGLAARQECEAAGGWM